MTENSDKPEQPELTPIDDLESNDLSDQHQFEYPEAENWSDRFDNLEEEEPLNEGDLGPGEKGADPESNEGDKETIIDPDDGSEIPSIPENFDLSPDAPETPAQKEESKKDSEAGAEQIKEEAE